VAAFGDSFTIYPWSSTASAQTTMHFDYSSNSGYPVQAYYPPAPVIEMPEGPMEWLKRRVTEITDLAYAA